MFSLQQTLFGQFDIDLAQLIAPDIGFESISNVKTHASAWHPNHWNLLFQHELNNQ